MPTLACLPWAAYAVLVLQYLSASQRPTPATYSQDAIGRSERLRRDLSVGLVRMYIRPPLVKERTTSPENTTNAPSAGRTRHVDSGDTRSCPHPSIDIYRPCRPQDLVNDYISPAQMRVAGLRLESWECLSTCTLWVSNQRSVLTAPSRLGSSPIIKEV